jgi:hypothetical protein
VANVLNNNFISDTELIERINEGVAELYELVVSVYEHYYEQSFSFTLAGGQGANTASLTSLTGGFFKDSTLEINPGTSNMRIVDRLGAHMSRDSQPSLTYEILSTPPTLYVYPPELSKGNYRLLYVPDAPVLALAAPGPQVDLDSTLTKWYKFIVFYGAIDVHRKRGKTDEALALAGDPNNPQPGTLAYERQRVLTMARNRQEAPQQVPTKRRRSNFWTTDDMP